VGCEVVVAAELEQPWMEANRIAGALEYRSSQVIVEHAAHDPAERCEGRDMATQEALQSLVEHETCKDRS
jgi:hypothetical protein